jgi:hypothetical protein
MKNGVLREAVRAHLAEFKKLKDLVSVVARLEVRTVGDNMPTVPDILTNMRAEPGVVVVKQLGAIRRAKRGREHLDVEIKFMPETRDAKEFLQVLGRTVKATAGIEIVVLMTMNGHRTTQESGKPWVF